MQIGMIGLGRMGSRMVQRLLRGGHDCLVYDVSADATRALARAGAHGAETLAALVHRLEAPRTVWLMVPAAAVESTLDHLAPLLAPGDTVVDGGNSHYRDDAPRAARLRERGLHYVDCGTSGGVWGLERGYCLMIGGETEVVRRLEPIFATLAPGIDAAPRTAARGGPPGTAEHGYLHCGSHGAGHFVKMVHNGIEYGLMAAYAEGLAILERARADSRETAENRPRAESRETTENRPREPSREAPQRRPEDAEASPAGSAEPYRYDLNLADVVEVWRRGSVIGSWLLDLTAEAMAGDPTLGGFAGRVADSGEGRWALHAAIDQGVPTPLLAAALFGRFASRGNAEFQNRVLSAMRLEFGGHREEAPES